MTLTTQILDALGDPILVAEPTGEVRLANRAATRLFGRTLSGLRLHDVFSEPDEEVAKFLRLSARSGEPIVGAFGINDGAQTRRLRIWGSRIGADDPGVVLRVEIPKTSEFSILSEKIASLNREIVERRRAQAVLEETLKHNQLLLRELNHRVKNNIQMLAGLFSARLREPSTPDLRAFVESAIRRLMAIGGVQRIMYEENRRGAVPVEELVRSIVNSLEALVPPGVKLEIRCAPALLSHDQAHPVALIINELVTNALKHGSQGTGTVVVACHRDGDELVLSVKDEGPGIPAEAGNRSSGLGLVRGLARQIGGKVSFFNDKGLRCEVSFRPAPIPFLS